MNAPIGVFDSGVGGLSVLREIRLALPNEDLLYVGDSGHAPYGDRPTEFVAERSESLARLLVTMGAKAIVVACNTATAISIDALRRQHSIPIIGLEPAIKPALATMRSGAVAVMATSQTLAGAKFAELVAVHANEARVIAVPCPGLVERIEVGDIDGPETEALVARYVNPIVAQGVDTIVLGCTHYSFVRPLIERVAGAGVAVLDSARAVARQVDRRLREAGIRSTFAERGAERFFTTGQVERVRPVLEALWGEAVSLGVLD